jgi:rhodanese-related sulfurtransferase
MITPTRLAQVLTENTTSLIVDVRTPVEFTEVHIPQAVNHPLDQLNGLPGVAKDQPIYLVCRSGTRASLAAQQLKEGGFTQTQVLEGGTLAWIKAGLPVERGQTRVISLERQVRIGAGTLVLTGVLLGTFVHPGFFILSGFVGGGLIFAGITDWCGMGLLLAKAPWNR